MKDLQVDQILKGIYQACANAMELFTPENMAQRIDRIILIGAHGTGKTTLANALAEVIETPVVESVAREVQKNIKYLENNDIIDVTNQSKNNLADAYQNVLCSMSRWDFMRWVKTGIPCIMTRCPLDTIAYAMADEKVSTEIVESNRLVLDNDEEFIDAIKNSLFVYIPIEFGIENDGIRPVDVTFQHQVDAAMRKLIYDFEIVPLVVTGSVEERMEAILVKVVGANVAKILMDGYKLKHS